MVGFSHSAMQVALYQALSADSTLMASVTGIFDRPPQNTIFPYVTFGESSCADWSSVTFTGTEQILALHVWSREGGRKQAAAVMERIYTLLHQADLTVDGQSLVMLRFLSSNILLENDGWTYQGLMHFRALLQANS